MDKKEELNLDNPIFVFYICTVGFTKLGAEQLMNELRKKFDIYKNATIWFLASETQTKIECIYDGWGESGLMVA
jgi:hypothetical protein